MRTDDAHSVANEPRGALGTEAGIDLTGVQMWVASPDYLAKRGVPAALEDLARHDLIHFDTVTLNRVWRQGEKEIRVEPRLRTDNADASIEAAIEGLGIARLFSYHVARHVTEGKLVRVLPNSEREAVPVSLVYQINRLQSAGHKAFLTAARTALPDCPEL